MVLPEEKRGPGVQLEQKDETSHALFAKLPPAEKLKPSAFRSETQIELGTHFFIKKVDNISTTTCSMNCSGRVYITWKPSRKEYEYLRTLTPDELDEVDVSDAELFWCPLQRIDQLLEPKDIAEFFNSADAELQSTAEKAIETVEFIHSTSGKSVSEILADEDYGELKDIQDTEAPFCFSMTIGDFTGIFSEPLELQNFPFDCQDFTVIFEWEEDFWQLWHNIKFVPCHVTSWGAVAVNFEDSNLDDWVPHKPIFEICYEGSGDDQCYIMLRFKLARNPWGHMGRTGVMNALLSLSVLCIFALDPEEHFNDRVNIVITLILAAVAFQYVVVSVLPPVPYLTILDKCTLGTFGFLGYILLELCIFETFESLHDSDDAQLYIALSMWALLQIWEGYLCYSGRTFENKKLTEDTKGLTDLGAEGYRPSFKVKTDEAVLNDFREKPSRVKRKKKKSNSRSHSTTRRENSRSNSTSRI